MATRCHGLRRRRAARLVSPSPKPTGPPAPCSCTRVLNRFPFPSHSADHRRLPTRVPAGERVCSPAMAPPPPRELLAIFEAALLGPAPPSPSQRVELLHAVRDAAPAFRALLSYPVRPPCAGHSLGCARIRRCRLVTRVCLIWVWASYSLCVWAGAEGFRPDSGGEQGGAASGHAAHHSRRHRRADCKLPSSSIFLWIAVI